MKRAYECARDRVEDAPRAIDDARERLESLLQTIEHANRSAATYGEIDPADIEDLRQCIADLGPIRAHLAALATTEPREYPLDDPRD